MLNTIRPLTALPVRHFGKHGFGPNGYGLSKLSPKELRFRQHQFEEALRVMQVAEMPKARYWGTGCVSFVRKLLVQAASANKKDWFATLEMMGTPTRHESSLIIRDLCEATLSIYAKDNARFRNAQDRFRQNGGLEWLEQRVLSFRHGEVEHLSGWVCLLWSSGQRDQLKIVATTGTVQEAVDAANAVKPEFLFGVVGAWQTRNAKDADIVIREEFEQNVGLNGDYEIALGAATKRLSILFDSENP